MYTYKVTIKEIQSEYVQHWTLTTAGDLAYVKNHFGLDDRYDIEWYAIEKEEDEDRREETYSV
jgi:hypothetical protein